MITAATAPPLQTRRRRPALPEGGRAAAGHNAYPHFTEMAGVEKAWSETRRGYESQSIGWSRSVATS
jgi:hypothetical protein